MREPNIVIMQPHHKVLTLDSTVKAMMETAEYMARGSYGSRNKIEEGSAEKFMVRGRRHPSIFEHLLISVELVCSRAAATQFRTHRFLKEMPEGFRIVPTEYSPIQESQRYCRYDDALAVIEPDNLKDEFGSADYTWWFERQKETHRAYLRAREKGWKPEDARRFLSADVKASISCSANVAAWRELLQKRALNPKAQGELRCLMSALLDDLKIQWPVLFGDLVEVKDW